MVFKRKMEEFFWHINKLEEFSQEEVYQCKLFTVQNYHAGATEHRNQ